MMEKILAFVIGVIIVLVIIWAIRKLTEKRIKDYVEEMEVEFDEIKNGEFKNTKDDIDELDSEQPFNLERRINFDLAELPSKKPYTVPMFSGGKKKTQTEICYEHLKSNGVIGLDKEMATNFYNIKNLSSQISKLRKDKHKVLTVNEDYTIEGEPKGDIRYVLVKQ